MKVREHGVLQGDPCFLLQGLEGFCVVVLPEVFQAQTDGLLFTVLFRRKTFTLMCFLTTFVCETERMDAIKNWIHYYWNSLAIKKHAKCLWRAETMTQFTESTKAVFYYYIAYFIYRRYCFRKKGKYNTMTVWLIRATWQACVLLPGFSDQHNKTWFDLYYSSPWMEIHYYPLIKIHYPSIHISSDFNSTYLVMIEPGHHCGSPHLNKQYRCWWMTGDNSPCCTS